MANRIFSTIGAGFTGSFLYNNVETVTDFVTNFGTSFVNALAISQNGGGDSRGSNDDVISAAADPAIRALAAQAGNKPHSVTPNLTSSPRLFVVIPAEALTAQLNAGGRGVTIYSSGARHGTVTAVLVPTALGLSTLWVYSAVTGASLSSWMYVSRQSFRKGMSAITSGMAQISAAVIKVRKELGERIDALGLKVDENIDVAKKTRQELGVMRDELEKVGVDVVEVRRLTLDVEEKLDRVMAAQGVTNRGVRLLCSVFDDASGKHHHQQQQQQERQKHVAELQQGGDRGMYVVPAEKTAPRGMSLKMLPSTSSASGAHEMGFWIPSSPEAKQGEGHGGDLRSEIGKYLREELNGEGHDGKGKDMNDFDELVDSLQESIEDIGNRYGR